MIQQHQQEMAYRLGRTYREWQQDARDQEEIGATPRQNKLTAGDRCLMVSTNGSHHYHWGHLRPFTVIVDRAVTYGYTDQEAERLIQHLMEQDRLGWRMAIIHCDLSGHMDFAAIHVNCAWPVYQWEYASAEGVGFYGSNYYAEEWFG